MLSTKALGSPPHSSLSSKLDPSLWTNACKLLSLGMPGLFKLVVFFFFQNQKSTTDLGIQRSWASWRALNSFSPTHPWHTAKSSHILFLNEIFLDPLFLNVITVGTLDLFSPNFSTVKNRCSNLNKAWEGECARQEGGVWRMLRGAEWLECQLCPQPLCKSPC